MIVLDSSFLIAYHNELDAHHNAAVPLMTRFLDAEWGRGLIIEYVFVEVVTVLLARRGAAVAAQIGRLLLTSKELEFVPCSSIFLEAWMHFSRQNKSRFSFTDVALLVECMRRGLPLLTFDEEFRNVQGLIVNPAQTPQQ